MFTRKTGIVQYFHRVLNLKRISCQTITSSFSNFKANEEEEQAGVAIEAIDFFGLLIHIFE